MKQASLISIYMKKKIIKPPFMHSVYRTHKGNAQPTKKLIDLIKKTAKIRNTWLENANSKNIYARMNLEGLNYISTKELQATFTKQSSLII